VKSVLNEVKVDREVDDSIIYIDWKCQDLDRTPGHLRTVFRASLSHPSSPNSGFHDQADTFDEK
jgi:hypothetical protein